MYINISVVLSTAGACAMSMGYIDSFLMMGYCYLALVLFYLSHWQTYVTGKSYLLYIAGKVKSNWNTYVICLMFMHWKYFLRSYEIWPDWRYWSTSYNDDDHGHNCDCWHWFLGNKSKCFEYNHDKILEISALMSVMCCEIDIEIPKFSGTRFPSIEILPTSVWNYLCFMELSANT